ncbi:MAG: hypothetical protein CMH50_01265 [Myxococcales bacterium]|nr:hypothetical protein [Myxococcales bacterium]
MRATLLVLAAAGLWATSGFFVKSPALAMIEPVSERGPMLACWRALSAAAILAPFVPWRQVRLTRRLWPLLFSFAGMNVTFVTAMTLADAGDAITLQHVAPLWVVVAGLLGWGEAAKRRDTFPLLLGLSGIAVIAFGASESGAGWGAVLALIAGLCYAGVILSLRALRDVDSYWLIFLAQLVSGLVLLPFAHGLHLSVSTVQWGWIAAFALVQMAAPYILFARGLRGLSAQRASLLALAEPVLNPVLVWFAWSQPIANHTLLGGGLIIVALVIQLAQQRHG